LSNSIAEYSNHLPDTVVQNMGQPEESVENRESIFQFPDFKIE
jgi:hypothetical protein